MNNALRITAFAAALAATFGTAYGVGRGVDPLVAAEDRPAGQHAGHSEGEEGGATGGADRAAGLQISDGGYTLALETPTVRAGAPTAIRFAVVDDTGRKVTAYQREHGKELHFILASTDLTEFRHLHPVRAADGTWSTTVDLPKAGGYRAFADFTPAAEGAENLTLGADLAVSGAYRPAALPAPSAVAEVDGYRVALDGRLRAGRSGELKLTVSRNGRPVTDLQPYLGAYGHLVALRSGDLAYLHVHPNESGPGPVVSFMASVPSAGTYRLFLDFQHEGKVRTAAFTVRVPASGQGAADRHESGTGAPAGHAH
ncbi:MULTISPECIES: hypothetical protein [unclassified Streptomyces]|uniref:hypothetical protein n=1 Tax=unclassified Streptomyces TaxID=2593676 RepID=UPI002259A7A8|nr:MULTISPECIES: hypothetical protein [unclassified Streptomyces]WSP53396.1 hypothetical protein OG306_02485 [Streptomyces sp. NBC_01241]WSU25932.1 hypothetical protein OG508_36870 [Streptomyces sp. NBC_01108]MCX4799276.1 hypothetical protein [Streptomyces sp. NBC_01242]WSJ40459.1 hypothetical protein OG772_33815 [Streptomyces sp. NBC_01321]WSP66776.1 hypothetical protein OG466_36560 [Streptomyces sp. NBC_01240]